MTTQEEIKQLSEILEELGRALDISEAQHNAVVSSYEAVGKLLSKPTSLLDKYSPIIRPQGSFMLGTMTKADGKDDLDIDLVCQLTGKNLNWTQYDLKQKVGDQIKSNDTYKAMLDKKEGRRCWTLVYSEGAKFHMDILPSIADSNYSIVLERTLAASDTGNLDSLAIRITDRFEDNYRTDTDHHYWLKSNPFGYGKWFYETCKTEFVRAFSLNESVKPVPKYQPEKYPLQRVVQILKRHRDMMFDGDDDKPISIIITTLAAKVYRKEINVVEALRNVVHKLRDEIKDVYSPKHNRIIKQILNPVNSQENFADKWPEKPRKQLLFYKWLDQLEIDVERVMQQRGLSKIQESFSQSFGKNTVSKAFTNYADNFRIMREQGNMRMASGTGFLGSVGTVVKNHNFDGNE